MAALPEPTDPAAAATPERGFGLYVHWPFCLSKCPYCDFNSHVRDGVDQGRWRRALLGELDYFAALTGRRRLTSIFFGGGTPSLMAPATAAAVIDRAAQHWDGVAGAEITLEANPTSVETAALAGYRAAGVNRLSLGVQSLDDDVLRFLGRGHSAAEAKAALAAAARTFARFSFDLIYARPGDSAERWRGELSHALALAGDHLSLYTLTIENGTAFAQQVARGDWRPLAPDVAAGLYDLTQEVCERAGLPAYEISNHARPGGACRHNLVYWRSGDYVGVGPGAHGRLTLGGRRLALQQRRKPETWLDAVEAHGHGGEASEPLDEASRVAETLLMGLRLSEGVDLANFAAVVGRPFDDVVPRRNSAALMRRGLLRRNRRRVGATPRGQRVLDAVIVALLRDDQLIGV